MGDNNKKSYGDRQAPRRGGEGKAQLLVIRIRGVMVDVRIVIVDPPPS